MQRIWLVIEDEFKEESNVLAAFFNEEDAKDFLKKLEENNKHLSIFSYRIDTLMAI